MGPTPTIADAAIHRWPQQPDIDAAISDAAIPSFASGRTMRWFFAPPRHTARLRFEVARL